MSGVIVVAPRDAAWARQAEAILSDARLHVARAHDRRIADFLMLAGGARVVLVDHRCIGATWPAQVERLRKVSPRTRILVVADRSLLPDVPGAVAWPDDPAAARALVEEP